MTAVEAAVSFAIVGSLVAVAVPAFVRDLHASKVSEAVDGIKSIAEAATDYARTHDVPHAYPDSAPLTPATVPRGERVVDAPGTWDHGSWTDLGFRPTAEGVPHAFSFQFDSVKAPARSTFRAAAHGDLDGDGTLSTFALTGHDGELKPPPIAGSASTVRPAASAGAAKLAPSPTMDLGPVIDPGMTVEAEVE
jgi:type II secretory pathway pseudopilin PulG